MRCSLVMSASIKHLEVFHTFEHESVDLLQSLVCSFVNWVCLLLLILALFHLFGAFTTRLPSTNLNDCHYQSAQSSAVLPMRDYAHCDYVDLWFSIMEVWKICADIYQAVFEVTHYLTDLTPVIAVKYLHHLFDGDWRYLITQRRIRCCGWKHDTPGKLLGTVLKLSN